MLSLSDGTTAMRTTMTRLCTVVVSAPLALTLLGGTGFAATTPAQDTPIQGVVSSGPVSAAPVVGPRPSRRTFGPSVPVRGLSHQR